MLYADSTQAPTESDWQALVRSIAAGDQAALRALYERTQRIVFTLIMRITQSPETAEEVTLEVFFDVWRRASKYDPADGTVIGWIMNQARSRAIDRVRFEQRKKRRKPECESVLREASSPSPEAVFDREERARLLHDALAVLTTGERRVLETAYFSGLTYAETAAQLDQPLGTIKTRARSALGKLRQTLSRSEKDS
ncbi:MAG TPA: sigma-70 family RNA polymerase sigma factor [Gammaproteobacteria bacterium]|nr:sigma-70 family RNA polymerase sigma factor [Gammaproteobacteria bacterium]